MDEGNATETAGLKKREPGVGSAGSVRSALLGGGNKNQSSTSAKKTPAKNSWPGPCSVTAVHATKPRTDEHRFQEPQGKQRWVQSSQPNSSATRKTNSAAGGGSVCGSKSGRRIGIPSQKIEEVRVHSVSSSRIYVGTCTPTSRWPGIALTLSLSVLMMSCFGCFGFPRKSCRECCSCNKKKWG